jgi:nucleoside-diphosphate-sugar epimerase
MKLLITGASGFLGAHVRDLAGDAAVFAPSKSELDLLASHDLVRERVAAIGATHLLHLAWYAVPGKFWTAIENYRWVGATMALVEGFADGGGRRLVAAGTCAEEMAPPTPYGVTKDSTRRLVESFAGQRGLSFAWGRVFFPYGPGEHPARLIPATIRELLGGGRAAVTDGLQRRDFVHVRDVASAFQMLAGSEVQGVVDIGTGEAVRVRDVVATIARELECEDRVDYGALPRRVNEPDLMVADATRLTSLGWRPRYDLLSGIRDSIRWWKKEGKCD